MPQNLSNNLQQYQNHVGLKYQLYNSLFSSLPFNKIEKTGMLLGVLLNSCEEGFNDGLSPNEILETFFTKNTNYNTAQDKIDMLFRFVQYVERQVVLFDALEDAAFNEVRDIHGAGTLKQLELDIVKNNDEKKLAETLKNFSLQLVLTAHPTQFYPGPVLGIINDLAKAVKENNTSDINIYLQQLGKTPFLQKQKPTPYDEAISLIWYLEFVFYKAIGRISDFLSTQFNADLSQIKPIVNLGFWPGGDRDGNPFVTAEITHRVTGALRSSIIKCYYLEIRKLKRRLTFVGVDIILTQLEKQLYDNIFIPGHKTNITKKEILDQLEKIKEIIIYQHNGLFLHLVNSLILKVQVFGLHFASLDVRQESTVHTFILNTVNGEAYEKLNTTEKINYLCHVNALPDGKNFTDDIINDTITNIKNIKTIQKENGELGCNRYIISQCNSGLHVMEVYGLFLLSGWQKEDLTVDIVPLFETIEDLKNAEQIMETLYTNKDYSNHLKLRNNRQPIMLGFSDGTKDGGYLMANYSIFKAKEALTKIAKTHNIEVVFFDGRGGPPARGGGKTHQYYASMGNTISTKEIQLTIQGQTISSNFGTVDIAQYNIEQLLHAGLTNSLKPKTAVAFTEPDINTFEALANKSHDAYLSLKNHPDFISYLTYVSPVKFYNETNIASRPSKRNATNAFSLKDLRAIPYVGAWAQIKQNVTGFFGLGTAIEALKTAGKTNELKALYNNSLFFRTLLDNSEMALKKCYFPLTNYLKNDKIYGEIWNIIYEEYELTKKNILWLSSKTTLMSNHPIDSSSIAMREKIVLPLLTIQQYAICKIRTLEQQNNNDPIVALYKKLIIRSSFGIINAGRNSA